MATIPAFAEVLLPTAISYGSRGGPEYVTLITATSGGQEQRIVQWELARGRWNIAYGVRTPTQLAELITFFRAVRGRATGFRFKDKADYQATLEVFGTGDGVETTFQLQKTYALGTSAAYVRPITKPVDATVQVFADGVEQVGNWSLDSTTGVVTFDSAPADEAELTWSGEFHVPCRFNTDHLPTSFEQFEIGAVHEIEIVEIRV
jgi:uncharacterized protein (TIGR02217 family)